jgi:hypothetical protein
MIQGRIRIIHYVPIWQSQDWLKLGWIIIQSYRSMPHHDSYSITMEWLCDCQMPVPLASPIS